MEWKMREKFDLFDKDIYKDMCQLCGRTQQTYRCFDAACWGDDVKDPFCVDKNNTCIPPIEDCKEHHKICINPCHGDCECQER